MIEQSITLYPEEVKVVQTNKTAYYSYGYRDDFSNFEIARELQRATECGTVVICVRKSSSSGSVVVGVVSPNKSTN